MSDRQRDSVPLDDRGLLLGDGLFETILCAAGDLAHWDAHLARMMRGCSVLGRPVPDGAQARDLCFKALGDAGLAGVRAAVRPTLTAGSGGRGLDRPPLPQPRLFATAAAAPAPQRPVRLVTASVRRNQASPASRLKTLAYLDNVLARREATDAGADEAVMLNTAGEVACAAAANLFWLRGDEILTPALECGVLDGVQRGVLIAAAAAEGVVVREVRASAADLARADVILVTNSLIGVAAAASLDGRALTSNPLAARLVALARQG